MAEPLTPPRAQIESRLAPASPLFCWILPALAVLSLLAACFLITAKRQLWGDEIFTWVEIRDPSLLHLLRVSPQLGGGGLPLFYLTAWLWGHIFGMSALALRLYSAIPTAGAFLLLLAALRRRFSPPAAFLGSAFGFFTSLMVVEQASVARVYGLYLLLAVLAVVAWLRVAESPQPRPRDLFLFALSQAGLVLGHILGLIYGALLLLALLLADAAARRFRPATYLAAIAGWLALLPSIPAILSAIAAGRPHGWIPAPGFGGLLGALSCWLFTGLYWPALQHHPLVFLAAWVCAFISIATLVLAALAALRNGSSAHRPLLILGLVLVAAPEVFYLISILAQPLLQPRYLIPSAIGVALLAASALAHTRALHGRAAVFFACILLLLPLAAAGLAEPKQFPATRVDQLAAGRPVVCANFDDFQFMLRGSSSPATLVYPLDWRAALLDERAAVTNFHLMQNYRRLGFLPNHLRDTAAILRLPSFLVLDNTRSPWFSLSVQHNPRFTWKVLAQLDMQRRIVEVDRKP